MTNPKVNTDRTLFEKDGNRVFVTEHGSLGIESHGHVIVRPIESWHDLSVPAAIPCSVCGGAGMPASGQPCICGGKGTESAEAQGLREYLNDVLIALGYYTHIPATTSKEYIMVKEAAIQQFGLQKSAEEISTEWKSEIESAIADSAKSLARVEDEVRRLNELYSILSQTYTER